MNETPFKFTSEEKEQTLQILERLRTAVGDTFKPGDEQHLREDIQHAFINHQIKRNVFGMNPILAAISSMRSVLICTSTHLFSGPSTVVCRLS